MSCPTAYERKQLLIAPKRLGQGWNNRWSHRYSSRCRCCNRREQKIPIFQGAYPALPRFPRHIYRHICRYVAACRVSTIFQY